MKIAFMFSGQGAQFPGMMKDLYAAEPAARQVFDAADSALGRGVSALCFEGSQDDLNLTHNTQPCVLAADLAAAMALRAHGVEPEGAAGFSLGEYAALAFAGAIGMADAFEIIQHRADAMQAAVAPGRGAMAAMMGGTPEQVEAVCAAVTDGYVVAANYNSPAQTVISGESAAVDQAIALAREQRIRGKKLAVSAPFHCALMASAARSLEDLFASRRFDAPAMPVYMNVDAAANTDAAAIPGLLVRQAMSPVRWMQTLLNMRTDGFDTFIECGPGKTLAGLASRTLQDVAILRVGDAPSLRETLDALGR